MNLAGGFILTSRMLEMFRRPTDPPEYTHYYLVPAAVSVGGYFATKAIGVDTVGMAYVASGVMCIGGIAAMSDMKTSRIANPIAMMGVTTGLAATLGAIQQTPEVYAQIAACTGIGAAAGFSIARGLAPTQLPETVPPPPPSRTKWTRLVHPSVLTGHVSSLSHRSRSSTRSSAPRPSPPPSAPT